MNEHELRERLSEAIAAADPGLSERIEQDPAAFLDLVRLAAAADGQVAELLAEVVGSARAAGHSWEAIGGALGISRQAAQQRFGAPRAGAVAATGERRTLSPLTAFNEMDVLNEAGRYGWRGVAYGILYHVVERSDQQWEHRRAYVAGPGRRRLEEQGWERIGSQWFPWVYYGRPTGQPVVDDPEAERAFLRRWAPDEQETTEPAAGRRAAD